MAHFVMFHAKVQDFAKWKKAYDSHISVRKEYGLSEEALYKRASDPNDIVLILKAAELNRAQEFVDDPKVRQVIRDSGLIGSPDISFLEKA